MGVKFGEIYNFLSSLNPAFSPSFCQDITNQARETLYRERDWGFLFEEGFLRIPPYINTGTVSVTKYSKEVIASANLATILDVITIDDVPIVGRQFRVRTGIVEKIYTIADWDTTTDKITLTEPYLGATNSSASFEVFKSLLNPPTYIHPLTGESIIDFRKFYPDSLLDLKNYGRLNTGRNISFINSLDSSRIAVGTPYLVSGFKKDSQGNQLFEFYPVERNSDERLFQALYIRDGYNFEDDDEEFPNIFSKEYLLSCAKAALFEWAEINKGDIPSLKGTNWFNLLAIANFKKEELKAQAIKNDEEGFPRAVIGTYESYPLLESNSWGARNVLVTNDNTMFFDF